jgi:hypothetical protein
VTEGQIDDFPAPGQLKTFCRADRPEARSSHRNRYLLCSFAGTFGAWMSHALWQGTPSVVGHTRFQASFWLAQLAKQASVAASARRNSPIKTLP